MFHAASIFLFIVPFLYALFKKDLSIKRILTITILSLIFVIYCGDLINWVVENSFFKGATSAKMVGYYDVSRNINGYLKVFIDISIVVLSYILLQKTKRNNAFTNSVFGIYLVLYILGINIGFFSRLAQFFVPFYYIILVEIIFASKYYGKVVFLAWCITLYTCVEQVYSYTKDNGDLNYGVTFRFYERYYPYHSIFDPVYEPARERFRGNEFNNR